MCESSDRTSGPISANIVFVLLFFLSCMRNARPTGNGVGLNVTAFLPTVLLKSPVPLFLLALTVGPIGGHIWVAARTSAVP